MDSMEHKAAFDDALKLTYDLSHPSQAYEALVYAQMLAAETDQPLFRARTELRRLSLDAQLKPEIDPLELNTEFEALLEYFWAENVQMLWFETRFERARVLMRTPHVHVAENELLETVTALEAHHHARAAMLAAEPQAQQAIDQLLWDSTTYTLNGAREALANLG